MKNLLKISAVLLVLCQLIFCFSSCGIDKIIGLVAGGNETESESENETTPTLEPTKETLADYVIVVPADTDEDMTDAAETLQRMIEKSVGVKLEIKKDTEAEVEYEILVGPTNRAEAQEFYKNVKQYDSGYARVGTKLLIVGRLNDKVADVALVFHATVLSPAGKSDVLLEDGAKEIFSDNAMNVLYDWIQQSTAKYYNPVLEGLTINALGDSYFEGAGLDSQYVWLNLLASKYDINMNNYGKGGSTVTN